MLIRMFKGRFANFCEVTDSIDGTLSAGNTFTHQADFLGEVIVTDNGTGNATRIRFRRQDDNNCWVIIIDASGNTSLYEVVTGGYTLRASGGATADGGARFVWVCDGETITGYVDDTQTWTYGSAANYKTQTTGNIFTIADAATYENLKTWPRGCPSADGGKW